VDFKDGMSMKEKQILNVVMYALYHVRNLDEVRSNKYMYNVYEYFVEKCDRKKQGEMISAIEWALDQVDIEDCCLLPRLPHNEAFKREYLKIVLSHLRNS
tara:strand:+ start:481 stop:780 length:300 start_codon:yes stop_codon:yes gene_type:complete